MRHLWALLLAPACFGQISVNVGGGVIPGFIADVCSGGSNEIPPANQAAVNSYTGQYKTFRWGVGPITCPIPATGLGTLQIQTIEPTVTGRGQRIQNFVVNGITQAPFDTFAQCGMNVPCSLAVRTTGTGTMNVSCTASIKNCLISAIVWSPDGVTPPSGLTGSGTTGQFASWTGSTVLGNAPFAPITDPGANGILARTSAGAFSSRTITGTADIGVTNGNGVAGNPALALLPTAVSAGSCGDTTHSCGLTVDANGRVTSRSNNVIAGGGGGGTCTTTGTGVVTGDGAGGCTNNSGVTIATNLLTATAGLTSGTGSGPGLVTIGTYTVGTLPSCVAGITGARTAVTDSNAASFTAGIGAVVAAGGSTVVPVFCDGSAWRIG